MYKIASFIFFLLLNIGYLKGQTITYQSSAEDCISFLNKKLNSAVGKINVEYPFEQISNINFNGSSYSKISRFDANSTLGTKNNYTSINWSNLLSTFFSEVNKNGVIEGKWIFKKGTGPIRQLTGVQLNDNNSIAYVVYGEQRDTVVFNVSITESSSLADIDKAAKRLSDIIKEKGDFLNTNTFKPKIIEGKPSLDQTMEYIRNNIPKTLSYYSSSGKTVMDSYSIEVNSILTEMFASTDSLYISFTEKLGYYDGSYKNVTKYMKTTYIVAMRDIESITSYASKGFNPFITFNETTNESNFPYGICLNAASGKPLIKKYTYNYNSASTLQNISSACLPIGGYRKTENSETVRQNLENSALFKAFNHLRKLCGAVEPLKFD